MQKQVYLHSIDTTFKVKTKLTRGLFNVKGAEGIIIVKMLEDHETVIGLPGTQQNGYKNIF